MAIFVVLNCRHEYIPKNNYGTSRPNNKLVYDNIQNQLGQEAYNDIYALEDPGEILNLLTDKLNALYDSCFPPYSRKARLYKAKSNPWIATALLKSCKKICYIGSI